MFRRTIFQMLIVLAVYSLTSGDVIMPGYHPIQRCAFVSNLSQYPDIVLIAVYQPAMSSLTLEKYIIQEDTCLWKGYKFCPFYIFWAEKNYLNSTGLSNIPFEDYIKANNNHVQDVNLNTKPLSIINSSVDPYGGQVPDSIKSTSEALEYKLIPATNGKGYTLYLASKTTHYSNGPDIIVKFQLIAPIQKNKKNLNKSDELVTASLGQGCLLLKCLHTGMIKAQLVDCRGCIVNRFTRVIQTDKYYPIPCPGVRSGMYWLKVESEDMEFSLPLRKL